MTDSVFSSKIYEFQFSYPLPCSLLGLNWMNMEKKKREGLNIGTVPKFLNAQRRDCPYV